MSGQMCSPAQANDLGHGRARMTGEIIETACAIETGSQYQDILMDTVPVSQIVRDGMGAEKNFGIRLSNCTLTPQDTYRPAWSVLEMTFDGATTDNNLFSVSGDAKGVGLQIKDSNGVIALPGHPLPTNEIHPGSLKLNYSLRLIGNRDALKPGSYHTIIRFKVDYF